MTDVPIQNFAIPADTDQDVILTVDTTVVGDTLVGSVVYFRVYEQEYGVILPGVDPVLQKSSRSGDGVVIPESPSMTVRISFARADTVGLLRSYYFEVTVVDEIGDQDPVLRGIVTVGQTENRIS